MITLLFSHLSSWAAPPASEPPLSRPGWTEPGSCPSQRWRPTPRPTRRSSAARVSPPSRHLASASRCPGRSVQRRAATWSPCSSPSARWSGLHKAAWKDHDNTSGCYERKLHEWNFNVKNHHNRFLRWYFRYYIMLFQMNQMTLQFPWALQYILVPAHCFLVCIQQTVTISENILKSNVHDLLRIKWRSKLAISCWTSSTR